MAITACHPAGKHDCDDAAGSLVPSIGLTEVLAAIFESAQMPTKITSLLQGGRGAQHWADGAFGGSGLRDGSPQDYR